MKKFLIISPFFCILIMRPTVVGAESLVNITSSGEVTMNVLGESNESEQKSTKPTFRFDGQLLKDITFKIFNEGRKTFLDIKGEGEIQTADITDISTNVVEIETENFPKKIKIGKLPEGFGISQDGITAVTTFPISIDTKERTVSLATESGEKNLAILPDEALTTVVRANIINVVSKDGKINLEEDEEGELLYTIKAERHINLFNIYDINVPVTAKVSANNGKVTGVEQPKWLTILGFLFS